MWRAYWSTVHIDSNSPSTLLQPLLCVVAACCAACLSYLDVAVYISHQPSSPPCALPFVRPSPHHTQSYTHTTSARQRPPPPHLVRFPFYIFRVHIHHSRRVDNSLLHIKGALRIWTDSPIPASNLLFSRLSIPPIISTDLEQQRLVLPPRAGICQINCSSQGEKGTFYLFKTKIYHVPPPPPPLAAPLSLWLPGVDNYHSCPARQWGTSIPGSARIIH